LFPLAAVSNPARISQCVETIFRNFRSAPEGGFIKTTDTVNCFGAANPLLLTDGTVMVQNGGCQDWWRLTPDDAGSYVNGTGSELASLPSGYSPLYHSSAVLPDGRVIIEGGEYNFFNPVWTAQGAITTR